MRFLCRLLILLFVFDSCHSIYDKNINIFSPNGELLQLMYAEKACDRGCGVLCLRTPSNEVILCTLSREADALMDRRSIDKIQKVDESIWVTFSGLLGDGRTLVSEARKYCSEFRERFGIAPTISALTNYIGDIQHQATMSGGLFIKPFRFPFMSLRIGTRPLAVEGIFFGYDNNILEPKIFMTHPSGNSH
jgi:20S proteasome alpha/beta subunit